jgi:hypothetical protein
MALFEALYRSFASGARSKAKPARRKPSRKP